MDFDFKRLLLNFAFFINYLSACVSAFGFPFVELQQ